ncbi:Secretion ATPase, PEP-CTERM locus subfamily [Candidatus Sulfobium mesophilum]|uniref:Secretion ATPase, PEP-CTERM locus subfamily n=1 Tax=Candidatus Sulfobium mesophilum TaxID=2016548 RepID=A0A2U3QDJ9_9BACT|nr:Secretion ATPase, PEP-CTERM locus subfamily [Candidatus Sulfobium mesophilum]
MYEQFFSLKTKPFDLVPNPDFLFLSKSHKKARVYLDYGIKERAGFILVTGEVGSGKTTIVRDLIKGLNGNSTLSRVFNTKVTSEQLMTMINEDFGLDVHNKDKISLLRELNDFLIDQYARKRQPILIIDEAQNLSPELLEEVRMLSNLETDRTKLLQIILVGQPELTKTLGRPELRQLRQRINIRCHLFPLTAEETEEYILHRLEIAGNREAIRFEKEVIDAIYGYSRGIPRLINIICDFLMLSAFAEETKVLTAEVVNEVIGELESENRYWHDESSGNNPSKLEESALIENTEHSARMLKISKERFLQIIKETVTRVDSLTEEFSKLQIFERGRNEILDRCSTAEEALNNHIARTDRQLSRLSAEMEDLFKKMELLRKQIDIIHRVPPSSQKKKKGLLRRIFS